jgi:DNA polymerase-3 subunit delta
MLLQAKELKARGFDNRNIGSKLGIPPFIAGKYVTQASRFKTSTLRNAVTQCVETEEAIKSGRMIDTMAVEILILSVLPA